MIGGHQIMAIWCLHEYLQTFTECIGAVCFKSDDVSNGQLGSQSYITGVLNAVVVCVCVSGGQFKVGATRASFYINRYNMYDNCL